MGVALAFAESIAKFRESLAHDKAKGALNRAEAGKAKRAAQAEAEGRADYKPRRWFANDAVRKLARERDREEQKSVKQATGVRPYTFYDTEEERQAARRESNRLASQRRRDRLKATPA